MITASKDIFYSVLKGEWKNSIIRVIQISNRMDPVIKFFKLEDFVFDTIEACENCQAPPSSCEDCDGTVEILALVGSLTVNGRNEEDGLVVPMLGDVLFDIREGHLVIMTDTYVTVITTVRSALIKEDICFNLALEVSEMVKGKQVELKSRLYLVNGTKIKRLGANALYDGRKFSELAGKKAIVLEVTYMMQDKKPLYIRAIRYFYAYFDLEGVIIENLTFPSNKMDYNGEITFNDKIVEGLKKEALEKINNPEPDEPDEEDSVKSEKVVQLGRRDVQPVLLQEEKALIKNRMIKDFGIEVWEKTSSRIKEKLE